MLYDITVIPKYGIEPPDTGDGANIAGLTVLLLASAVILGQKIKKNVKKVVKVFILFYKKIVLWYN